MARTKVCISLQSSPYRGADVVVVVVVCSKPPASPPEVGTFFFHKISEEILTRYAGKAPRKQLATKAARKTAAVRTGLLAVAVVADIMNHNRPPPVV